ncbi:MULTISPECIES: hypothetical protein [Achromobacter]|uniref:Uncharacterized protein n=1 Tax=Achromobacter mucicolens TaxID=1389922 RepID=A0ABM8LK80_9BURK|nr:MULTISPECIES: hypothetical protein [Achromobacter]AVG44104.1 hypothetical protein MC81_31985 [Achromobacter insolitus]CAB3847811.1 hypothetical protein LMG3410_01611 [Achromobacter aegrifaciens]CAB3912269.1 hypothetical protein LMG3415_05036 [Achromobacter mucicolens]
MRTGVSPELFSREQAEQLHKLRDRLELAPVTGRPFSTSRMFQDLAMSGALDKLPAPESCAPLADLIREESPFMRGRQHILDAIRNAQAMHEGLQDHHVVAEASIPRPQERPRG